MHDRRMTLPLISILLAALIALAGMNAQAQPGARCFAETGYCIAGRVREYWEQNGGLPVFGFPITPQRDELVEGQTFQAQWFERHRMELHPANPRPYDVLLGRLGADSLSSQDRDWRSFPAGAAQPGCSFFPETNHSVCGDFLAAWRANGLEFDGRAGASAAESLALFGLPLSEAQTETIGDKQYVVQWFERARFESHPENRPPYQVLFGLLGAEQLHRLTPTPTPTLTPTPTATPKSTSKPRPSRPRPTAVPSPTSAPAPTNTPRTQPTPQPTAGPTPTLPGYP
jgi:hypothetical protein